MKVLGYEPVSYKRKDGNQASGTRLYVQHDENLNVTGIGTENIWLKDNVFRAFVDECGGMDRVLGRCCEVYYNQYKTPIRVIPTSEY